MQHESCTGTEPRAQHHQQTWHGLSASLTAGWHPRHHGLADSMAQAGTHATTGWQTAWHRLAS